MPTEQATYTHGHHTSVVTMHARRTAANSAGFLLPHLKPTSRILDIGCGPGSITVGLAQAVPQGEVIGLDAVEGVLSQARDFATAKNVTNIKFVTGDANALEFKDGEFDVVFCHQVLQHVKDPVGILREMRRVCKVGGGIVAAREADYASFVWYPRPKEFDTWAEVYQKVARVNGGEPDAGRYVQKWAREAGWKKEDVTVSWGSWCYTGEDAEAWAVGWKGRAVESDFARTAVEKGIVGRDVLEGISKAWARWAIGSVEEGGYEGCEDRIMVVGNGEILCRC